MANWKFVRFFSVLAILSPVFLSLVLCTTVEEDLSLARDEKAILDKFKKRVAARVPHAYMREEIYLMRWLRARNFNIPQAESLLNENLKWRKTNKIDKILEEDWSDMLQEFPYWTDSVAKDGKPIITGNMGSWDLRQVAVTGRIPRYIRYLWRAMEHGTVMVRDFQAQGKNVSQYDFIINMENYNVIQHACVQCIQLYVALVTAYENYYPGFTDHMILFRTPPIFEAVLTVIRPLMSPITRKSLRVYGENENIWTKALYDIVDKSQLRPEFGGTKSD